MMKYFVLTILALLSAQTLAAGNTEAALRGNRYQEEEERNTLVLCNMVEGAFDGEVDCTCSNRWLFGEISFSCITKETTCSDLPGTGTYCAKTSFEGKFNWFFFQLKTSVSMKACQTSVWANNTVAGDVLVGDICFQLGVTGRIVGDSGITGCEGTFKDVTCKTCTKCTYDSPKTNRTGVKLGCNNLAVDPCFPFEVPIFVSGREDETMDPREMLASFDPVAVTKGPAMEFALLEVEKAAEALRI